jgi:hypothetical protein
MNAKQTRTLKLVPEPTASEQPDLCQTCEARRQLEHVKMLLQAALIAASKPIAPPTLGKP